jgi:hypothetical protein
VAGPGPMAELERALEATAQALESGDPVAAEAASGLAAAACAQLEALGLDLPRAELERAAALQRRCAASADSTLHRLAGQLELAGRSRRAGDAYRR